MCCAFRVQSRVGVRVESESESIFHFLFHYLMPPSAVKAVWRESRKSINNKTTAKHKSHYGMIHSPDWMFASSATSQSSQKSNVCVTIIIKGTSIMTLYFCGWARKPFSRKYWKTCSFIFYENNVLKKRTSGAQPKENKSPNQQFKLKNFKTFWNQLNLSYSSILFFGLQTRNWTAGQFLSHVKQVDHHCTLFSY